VNTNRFIMIIILIFHLVVIVTLSVSMIIAVNLRWIISTYCDCV